ncbi:hypothetical protein P3S68_020481 [Capsicum galapagoense]
MAGKNRSFAGLGFLSLYVAGKIKAFDRRGHVAKLCIVFLPLLMASLVGVSRVDDYWHHWQDVFAGGLIGLFVATFCNLQFFPAPYHTEGTFYTSALSQRVMIQAKALHKISFTRLYCYSGQDTETNAICSFLSLFSGWGPYAYFRAVEEVRSSRQHVQPANGGSEVARPDVQLNQQSHKTTSPFEDV